MTTQVEGVTELYRKKERRQSRHAWLCGGCHYQKRELPKPRAGRRDAGAKTPLFCGRVWLTLDKMREGRLHPFPQCWCPELAACSPYSWWCLWNVGDWLAGWLAVAPRRDETAKQALLVSVCAISFRLHEKNLQR